LKSAYFLKHVVIAWPNDILAPLDERIGLCHRLLLTCRVG
jgi:hypothetical protein